MIMNIEIKKAIRAQRGAERQLGHRGKQKTSVREDKLLKKAEKGKVRTEKSAKGKTKNENGARESEMQ
jgi:hypothetical protein